MGTKPVVVEMAYEGRDIEGRERGEREPMVYCAGDVLIVGIM